jgi:hypothetical protein
MKYTRQATHVAIPGTTVKFATYKCPITGKDMVAFKFKNGEKSTDNAVRFFNLFTETK